MQNLTVDERNDLASMMVKGVELSDVSGPYNATNKQYVDGKISLVVEESKAAVNAILDGAGPLLDTLKELGTALGNDSNFATAITTQIFNVQQTVTQEAIDRTSQDVIIHSQIDSITMSLENKASINDIQLLNIRADGVVEDLRFSNNVREQGDAANEAYTTRVRELVTESANQSAAQLELVSKAVEAESLARIDAIGMIAQSKMDVSPYYSGGSEQPLKISEYSYLSLGDKWRIVCNNGSNIKRLEFQYCDDGSNFKTAVPFIRESPVVVVDPNATVGA